MKAEVDHYRQGMAVVIIAPIGAGVAEAVHGDSAVGTRSKCGMLTAVDM